MSTSVRKPNSPASVRPSSSWRWLAFAAACLAAVMDLLDSTIAQVAAPAIRADLGGSYLVIEWVTAGYTLAMAVGLLTGGRLGDLYGRKRMLLVGIAGFMVASAACAVAANPGELIAARVAQGAVGALMIPQVLGLIQDLFPREQMAKAIGVYGPVMGMVFVPLFDIILADVSPRVIGSASGVLQTINSLGMALGVAGLGAVFFGLLSGSASHTQVYSSAAQWTSALTIALLVASFVLGFWMPRRAREQGEAQAAAAEPAPELAGRH